MRARREVCRSISCTHTARERRAGRPLWDWSQPSFLTAADPLYGESADDIAGLSRSAGLPGSFQRRDDRVLVA
ncbi:MAG: hypothetical protein C0489_11190 [Candidatus Accumulibacter sp.]|nr:hypothetical protein [Accumulibacter sp.]